MSGVTVLSPTLSLYIARRFLASFAIVLLSLCAIIFLLDTIELMRRTSTRPDISVPLLLEMALLKLPYMAQKIVPFATLFGGMHTFSRLTRFQELVVARSAGISVWQFLLPAVTSMVCIGIFSIAVFNPLASAMLSRYDTLESKLVLGQTNLLAMSRTGLWLRQADEVGQAVIHATSVTQPDLVLHGVIIFMYEGTDKFISRIDADEARLDDGVWQLKNVLLTAPGQPPQSLPTYQVKTDWTPEKIQDSFAAPETMSFWDLPGFIRLLDNAGFSANRHRLYWNSLLSVPAMLAAMVLIAASFSMRSSRRGGTAALIGGGVLFGFMLFFLSDVVLALGLSASIPAALAAWTPAGFSMALGLAALLHLEDG
ncbi:MAG TPA: LPS export ABC transporter permease LptG [Alphaproteobacteria bacterium]|jgi:lipopolysaccharide export system permease protein